MPSSKKHSSSQSVRDLRVGATKGWLTVTGCLQTKKHKTVSPNYLDKVSDWEDAMEWNIPK